MALQFNNMQMIFLLALMSLQPSMKVVEKRGDVMVLRVTIPGDRNRTVGGLVAYSHHIPTIRIINSDPELAGEKGDMLELGSPALLRDYCVLPFSVKGGKDINGVDLEIDAAFEGGSSSYAFESLYRSLIVNYEPSQTTAPGVYLIITPDEFLDGIEPLANWKRKKGWDVRVAALSETGSDANSIKTYISNLYETIDLEYVLLVGDAPTPVPAFTNILNCPVTDHPYSTISGDDFLPDIIVGRLPVSNEGELATVVAKLLRYDMSPYVDDTLWYRRALMVGANYPDYVTTALPTKRCVRDRLLARGFETVDTVFYPPVSNGVEMITNSVNSGVLFVNYRGGRASVNKWDVPQFRIDDIYGLSNDWKLPLIVSLVCYTGSFDAPECFGEAWLRAGTPYQPKGGIAFIGPGSASTSTRWNNCLDYGIYWAILEEDVPTVGQVLIRGKIELLCNFPLEQFGSSGVERYFNDYNLLGDPEMTVWRDVPERILVTHPDTLPIGSSLFAVGVEDVSHRPIENALVSAFKEGEVRATGFTDGNGICMLNIEPRTSGSLYLTVTKRGILPCLDSISVEPNNIYVGYFSHTIGGDGTISSGETTFVNVSLKNYGSATATGVSAVLGADEYITVIDSMFEFGSIGAGEEKEGIYSFAVSSGCRNGHAVQFTIKSSSGNYVWSSGFIDSVSSPDFSFDTVAVAGDGTIDPGEEENIYITVGNDGSYTAYDVDGILRNLTSTASVTDSTDYFGELMPDSTSMGTFSVGIYSGVAVGKRVPFELFLRTADGFMDTVFFCITAGEPDTTAPLGPDEYGYYAYDDADTDFDARPTYSWVEIDTGFGGGGTCLPLRDDEVKTVSLPFAFRFYGEEYTQISVCANGFLSMGVDICNDMYNWHIPSSMGPTSLVAPFWDNFDPDTTTSSDSTGDVFYFYDESNHRFIVEWSRVQHILGFIHEIPSELLTFEAVLMHPGYYPTPTGDGEIIFQYHTVKNDDSWHNYATVGIEDHNHQCGVEYTFANSYPPEASPIRNGRAIKFTTQPPDTFLGTDKRYEGMPALLISPNPTFGALVIKLKGIDADLANSRLVVYDLAGRYICEIPVKLPNTRIFWDGTDAGGRKLSQGLYFLKLSCGNVDITRKFVILR